MQDHSLGEAKDLGCFLFSIQEVLKEGILPLLHIKENPIAQVFQAQAETPKIDKLISPIFFFGCMLLRIVLKFIFNI
jgi:hypothetical protein